MESISWWIQGPYADRPPGDLRPASCSDSSELSRATPARWALSTWITSWSTTSSSRRNSSRSLHGRLVHLPRCYQVNDSRREIAARTPSRAECGCRSRALSSVASTAVTRSPPDMFDVWMRLLGAVPGSVLWLLDGNPMVPGNLRRGPRRGGGRRAAGLRTVADPGGASGAGWPWPTCSWNLSRQCPYDGQRQFVGGLPVLTLAGETFVSRVAGSLLCDVGLRRIDHDVA